MENKEYYKIPIKFKKAEIPQFQEDRDRVYEQMNNTIDKSIGEILENLYEYKEDEYYIGIHRTCHDKESLLKNGIIYEDDINPTFGNHVQIFKNFPLMLREISYCENYKGSTGCIIVKIPKKDVKRDFVNETTEPIYYRNSNGKIYLRPEFLAGYVTVSNKELKSFEFNKYNHKEIYNENTEYYYDYCILERNIMNKAV